MFAANLNGMLYISKSTSAEEVTSSSWAEARASRTKPGQLSAKDLIRIRLIDQSAYDQM